MRRPLPHAYAAVLLLAAAFSLAACQSNAPVQPQVAPQEQQTQPEPPPVQRLVLTEQDVGEHLEATDLVAGVADWISSMPDPALAALTRRSLWNDGRIFVPPNGAMGETFWLHVFSDVSAESAEAWVRYLAAQPPETALFFTSPSHALVEALPVEPPTVGSAALAVNLLHGNAGGRYRTEVIVFAQGSAVVFLRNSRREHLPRNTDLPAIAALISARLAAPPPAE